MLDDFPIAGDLDSRFDPVRDAFAKNFADGDELGACFAVCIDGQLAVDLRGGYVDRKQETLWSEDTIACIYSSGKAVLTLLIAREVSNGALDYEKPVAEYWPEFASAGKESITIAEALSHQGGLCGFPDEMSPADWLDWDLICSRLAAMAPLWEPGSASGYHPQTFGFIAGELLRRVTGSSVGDILRRDFESQGLQIYCGMRHDQFARAASMRKPPKPPDLGEINDYTKVAFLTPWYSPAKVDPEDWAAAEIPASNMHADARSLARAIFPFANNGSCTDGDPYLYDDWEVALEDRISGPDLVLPFNLTWAAGVMRNTLGHFGPNERAYGHAGFGGSCVMFEPQNRVSMAYVMNKMSPYLVGDPRAKRLINVVYECL